MQTVNPHLVEAVLAGLTGLADDDEEGLNLYNSINPNNEAQVKQVIRKYLKPEFTEGGYAYQQGIKTSLAYYLTTGRIDFKRVYESCLLPFDAPTPARLFFEWIWQEYFPEENFKVNDINSYKEKDDLYEPQRLSMKRFT